MDNKINDILRNEINNIIHSFDIIKQLKDEMCKEHSKLDLKNSDLLHEIEFAKHDASNMVKVYLEIKENLIKRRVIKNSISYLDSTFGSGYNFSHVKNKDLECLKRLDNKSYVAKILTDLDFTDSKTLYYSRKNKPSIKKD